MFTLPLLTTVITYNDVFLNTNPVTVSCGALSIVDYFKYDSTAVSVGCSIVPGGTFIIRQ
jgi:hypothetical protein